MFDAEKLLGGLLLGGARRETGIDSLIPGAAGMVVLGVAMEAFEHFMNKSGATSTGSPSPPPPPSSVPPPPPGGAPNTLSPPPPPPNREGEAVLLIRAMIAAANADGTICREERVAIFDHMKGLNMTSEEQSFIERELLAPAVLDDIVKQVRTPEMARRVYTVSLMAIIVDTDSERAYMKNLAERLGLDTITVNGIHRDLGVEPPK